MSEAISLLERTALFRKLVVVDSPRGNGREGVLSDVLRDLVRFLESAIPHGKRIDPGMLHAHGAPHALSMINHLDELIHLLPLKRSLARHGLFLAVASPLIHCIGTLLSDLDQDHNKRRHVSVDFVSHARGIFGTPIDEVSVAALRLLVATSSVRDLGESLYNDWHFPIAHREPERVPMRQLALAVLLANALDFGPHRLPESISSPEARRESLPQVVSRYGADFLARTYLVEDFSLQVDRQDIRCELRLSRGSRSQLERAQHTFDAQFRRWRTHLRELAVPESVRLSWQIALNPGADDALTGVILEQADLAAEPEPNALRLYLLGALEEFFDAAGNPECPLRLQAALALDWVRAARLKEEKLLLELPTDSEGTTYESLGRLLDDMPDRAEDIVKVVLDGTFALSQYDDLRDAIVQCILDRAANLPRPLRSDRSLMKLGKEAMSLMPLPRQSYRGLADVVLTITQRTSQKRMAGLVLRKLTDLDTDAAVAAVEEICAARPALFAAAPDATSRLALYLLDRLQAGPTPADTRPVEDALARMVTGGQLGPDLQETIWSVLDKETELPRLVLAILAADSPPIDKEETIRWWRELAALLQQPCADAIQNELAASLARLSREVEGLKRSDVERLDRLLESASLGSLKAAYLRAARLAVDREVRGRIRNADSSRMLQ